MKKNRISVTCAFCGKNFEKSPSKLKNSKSGLYFCDKNCKCSAQRIGGIKEIMPSHYGTMTKGLSLKDVNRFNLEIKCIDCGELKEYLLCLHHMDGIRSNNDVNNLEIVCYNCHVKRHLTFKDNKWVVSFNSLTPREMILSL